MEYIKNIIFLTILLILSGIFVGNSNASEQRVYDLVLNYDKGLITKNSLTVTVGIFFEVLDQPDNGYRLEVRSFDQKILYVQKFLFEMVGTKITVGENKVTIDKDSQELIFPFFPNGKEIDIYSPQNTKILEIPVMQFAETCGNSVCEPQENYQTCPMDCPIPSATKNNSKRSDNLTRTSLIILSSPVSVGLLIAVIYWIIKRRKQKANTLP